MNLNKTTIKILIRTILTLVSIIIVIVGVAETISIVMK